MAKKSKKELRAAKREKSQLKKLRDKLGVKVDLRKKPGRKERNLLQKFKDVLTGKSTVVDVGSKTRAKRYRDFKKVGSKVVVPRRKGERIRATKEGDIATTRKVRGKTVKSVIAPKKPGEIKTPKGKRKIIAIPFQSPGGIVYQRFPNWAEAETFMQGYERYKNWKDYVVVEFVDKESGDDEGEQ